MIYLILVLGLFVLTYIYDYKGRDSGRLMWIIIIALVFIMIAGFRYRLGTDSIRYERYFVEGPDLTTISSKHFMNTRFSPLYILLAVSVRTITDQFVVFQLIHATIVNCVVFYFLYKNTRKIFFAATLYFFTLYFSLNMEVLRESLAVAVFLLAWPFFKDGKWLKWYILSVIGFLCHTSAVFMFILPVIVLPGIKSLFVFGKRTVFICIGIFVLALFIRTRFFDYIQAVAVFENVAERAKVYSTNDLASSSLNPFGIVGNAVRFVAYPLIALYFLSLKDQSSFQRNERFVSLTIMSSYIGVVAMVIAIFYRYNNYFLFFPIVVLSDFLFTNLKVNARKIRLNFLTWVILFIPIFVLDVHFGVMGSANKSGTLKGYMNYYPYASRFDMEKDEDREKLFKYRHAY